MIEIRIVELLENRRQSFYWLAKETGISHTTLWRLKKGKALGINFATLDKMCQTLECQLGDVLSHTNGKKLSKRTSPRKTTGELASRAQIGNPKAIRKKDKYLRHGR